MVTMQFPDAAKLEEVIADRRAKGLDKPDEVWDGTYVVMPNPGNEHQKFVLRIGRACEDIAPASSVVLPGCNVSDREDDWTENYRVPDVAVFLPGNAAVDRGSHYLGGPDLAVEVISRGDRTKEKFAFYAKVGVRELVLVERDPWLVTVYRIVHGTFEPDSSATPGRGGAASRILPMTWSLTLANGDRPQLILTSGGQTWRA